MATEPVPRPAPERLELGRYPEQYEFPTRYADMDTFGHITNTALGGYYDEARSRFNAGIFGADRMRSPDDFLPAVAQVVIHFLGEAVWPNSLVVGVGLTRIGRSSYGLGFGMFQRSACVGVSDSLSVYVADGGPSAIPAEIRHRLESLLLESN